MKHLFFLAVMTLAVLLCSCEKSRFDTLIDVGEDFFKTKPVVYYEEDLGFYKSSSSGDFAKDSAEIYNDTQILAEKVRAVLGVEDKKKSYSKQHDSSIDYYWNRNDCHVTIHACVIENSTVTFDANTGETAYIDERKIELDYIVGPNTSK